MERITRDKPLPLFKGASLNRKEQTVEGNAVLFQNHVERVLVGAEEGTLAPRFGQARTTSRLVKRNSMALILLGNLSSSDDAPWAGKAQGARRKV